jgi:hypothetical protein
MTTTRSADDVCKIMNTLFNGITQVLSVLDPPQSGTIVDDPEQFMEALVKEELCMNKPPMPNFTLNKLSKHSKASPSNKHYTPPTPLEKPYEQGFACAGQFPEPRKFQSRGVEFV